MDNPSCFSLLTMASRSGWQVFKKNWLADPATYPVIIVMAGAVSLCTFFSARTLFTHPDVYMNPERRRMILRPDNSEQVEKYMDNWVKRHTINKEHVSFPSLNNYLLKRKLKSKGLLDDEDDDDE